MKHHTLGDEWVTNLFWKKNQERLGPELRITHSIHCPNHSRHNHSILPPTEHTSTGLKLSKNTAEMITFTLSNR